MDTIDMNEIYQWYDILNGCQKIENHEGQRVVKL